MLPVPGIPADACAAAGEHAVEAEGSGSSKP